MNTKQLVTTAAIFIFGITLGKYGGSTNKSLRDQMIPVEGLSLTDVVFTEGPNKNKFAKIVTIIHETPNGVVRYGHASDADVTTDMLKITGLFCGNKITAFGHLREEQIGGP